MMEWLHHMGNRITRLCGEPNTGISGISHQQTQKIQEHFTENLFAYLLPYAWYEEEHGIFINQNSLGFAIEIYPLAGCEDTHQKEMHHLFEEVLEEEASIQCLLFADHRIDAFLRKWQSSPLQTDVFGEMIKKRMEFFQKTKRNSPRLFRCIFSYTIPLHGLPDQGRLKALQIKKEKMLKILASLSYGFCWTAKHFIECVGGLVNFSLSTEKKHKEWNPYQTLASQLTSGGIIKVEEEGLKWKSEQDIAFKSFRVIDYPSSWSLAAMNYLIGDVMRDNYRLAVPFYLHYVVHCPNQDKAEKNFKVRSHLVEKQGRSATLLRMIPELDEELQECRRVRQATNQGARFVWTQFSAGIWAETREMATAAQTLKSLFRLHQFQLAENHYLHLPHFLSALPLSGRELMQDFKNLRDLLKTTLTSECANFIPLQGEWQGTAPHPGMLLMGRRGQLINWNPFDNKKGNYNVVVAGRSGYGKSVFMQELMFNGLRAGARVFVLEVGRSFAKLCDLLGGQALDFSKHSPICLNPFTHIPLDDEEERLVSFGYLKAIVACMAAPTKGTTDPENSLIEKAIRYAWEQKQNQATISDLATWLEAQDSEQAKNLGMVLTPYTKEGIYARYFEGINNVNFINPLVLIELEELKGNKDLQAVVLQIFIMTIANQIFLGDRKTPFYICIDEAWDLLESQQMGNFIGMLARRLRKYRGSLVVGTQGIEDFFSKPGAEAAFANSDWKCFLAHKKDGVAKVMESGQYKVSEQQQMAMESVTTRQGEYSEIMICDGDGGYAITRLVIDPFSNLLYSTKAEEFTRLQELKRKGFTIAEAIHELLRSHNGETN
jgi:conjugal transfer ATP-binding protein TraC